LSFVSPRSDEEEEEEEEEKVVFAPAANASPSVKAQSCPSLSRLLTLRVSLALEREREHQPHEEKKERIRSGSRNELEIARDSADSFPQSFAFLTNIFFPKNPLTERES